MQAAAAILERIAAAQSADPATDDMTVPLAIELAEAETQRRNVVLERDRMATVLKAIVDCYGVGTTPEKFCEHISEFIEQGRKLLADSGHKYV